MGGQDGGVGGGLAKQKTLGHEFYMKVAKKSKFMKHATELYNTVVYRAVGILDIDDAIRSSGHFVP